MAWATKKGIAIDHGEEIIAVSIYQKNSQKLSLTYTKFGHIKKLRDSSLGVQS